MVRLVKVKHFSIGPKQPLVLISGPCVIESKEHALQAAALLKEQLAGLPVHLVYKSSYDKANRTSAHSFRGPGLENGLKILDAVKKEFDLPILSDIHSVGEIPAAAEVCDILQIPAFLCRQTDLVVAAGNSGAVINVKKGQFVAPWDMGNVVEKLLATGNSRIILTDRGTSFGYNNLVADMRSIPIMQRFGFPVCFDASHSVQIPGGNGTSSGGQREFISVLAKSAIAAGANCLFIESHPNPAEAKSDKDSVLALSDLRDLIEDILPIYHHIQKMEDVCTTV
ncbi:MAG: 3-deoxy-8-phosphooctulonate synthase [Simkania sp.]|nr:3-deoxy-8-phosphooctulonate synthase [Simkania sp.]